MLAEETVFNKYANILRSPPIPSYTCTRWELTIWPRYVFLQAHRAAQHWRWKRMGSICPDIAPANPSEPHKVKFKEMSHTNQWLPCPSLAGFLVHDAEPKEYTHSWELFVFCGGVFFGFCWWIFWFGFFAFLLVVFAGSVVRWCFCVLFFFFFFLRYWLW